MKINHETIGLLALLAFICILVVLAVTRYQESSKDIVTIGVDGNLDICWGDSADACDDSIKITPGTGGINENIADCDTCGDPSPWIQSLADQRRVEREYRNHWDSQYIGAICDLLVKHGDTSTVLFDTWDGLNWADDGKVELLCVKDCRDYVEQPPKCEPCDTNYEWCRDQGGEWCEIRYCTTAEINDSINGTSSANTWPDGTE
jgi:hypothetical protein